MPKTSTVLKAPPPGPRAPLPLSIQVRLSELKKDVATKGGVKIVKDFAIFIDTHRDQPHIGTFFEDIHRGMCRPTKVDYIPYDPATAAGDLLVNQENGRTLRRHEKHMFVTEEWFSNFLVQKLVAGEQDPRDGDGVMATSHLRDARAKVYQLKSFRQIVVDRWLNDSRTKVALKPKRISRP